MKNNVKRMVVAALVVVMLVCTLTGCATKLEGTYKNNGLITQTFTFADDKVTFSAFGVEAEGTYRIEDEKLIITYTLFGLSYDMDFDFKKNGKNIIVNGSEFVKE